LGHVQVIDANRLLFDPYLTRPRLRLRDGLGLQNIRATCLRQTDCDTHCRLPLQPQRGGDFLDDSEIYHFKNHESSGFQTMISSSDVDRRGYDGKLLSTAIDLPHVSR
jgi:hypothetical protein